MQVSGLGREIGRQGGGGPLAVGPSISNAIQTDAAINPGEQLRDMVAAARGVVTAGDRLV